MDKILLVEDNDLILKLVIKKFNDRTNFKILTAGTKAKTEELLNNEKHEFLAAVLDYHLPDAPQGDVINLVVKKKIPSIVFTGSIDEKTRENIWKKNIADYVQKNDPKSIDYIIDQIIRIKKNTNIKVLVTDDQPIIRKYLSSLLKIHRYQIFEATNGKEALSIINKEEDIKLVITDFNMPKIDGFKLTEEIRNKYTKDEMAIIGISSEGQNHLAAKFLKMGANDFIVKQSLLPEEFYCRIEQNLQTLELIEKLKLASTRDYLTGLYNRRHFFHIGNKLFENKMRGSITLTCAMFDIDHFKKINDTYGHSAGDFALRLVSDTLKNRMRKSDLVSRFGGEEFCILAANMDKKKTFEIFDSLRKNIKSACIKLPDGNSISLSVSIGVFTGWAKTLNNMIKEADMLMYKAKNTGRNKVIID